MNMENMKWLEAEIREVKDKIDTLKQSITVEKQREENLLAKRVIVAKEEAEKDRIRKIMEEMKSLNLVNVTVPTLNTTRISEVIEIFQTLHDEALHVNRYTADVDYELNVVRNNLTKLHEDTKTLTEYLTSLTLQFKYHITQARQQLDSYSSLCCAVEE